MAQQTSCNIRPATPQDASAITHVQIASWRTTYQGIIPDHTLAELSHDTQRQQAEIGLANPNMQTFVAETGPILFGFISGGPNRALNIQPNAPSQYINTTPIPGDTAYEAEIYSLYLLEDHQGQGAGRALVRTLAASLQGSGYKSLIVWALEANPAVNFYKRLGAIPITLSTINIGGQELGDQALGWPNLSQLLT